MEKTTHRAIIVPLVLLFIWCVMGVLVCCWPSALVLNSAYSSDSLIPLSGAWALHSGLRIHTDFSTPLGLACYLPYYWAMEIFGNTANVIRQVDAGIYVVVSILAFLLLKPPRFSWLAAALRSCPHQSDRCQSMCLRRPANYHLGRRPIQLALRRSWLPVLPHCYGQNRLGRQGSGDTCRLPRVGGVRQI